MTDKAEIRFYHLERQSLEQVLPGLITKALENGRRVMIRTATEAQAETLSEHLWTHDPASFIPHGTLKDGHSARQPVVLTAAPENVNSSTMLVLTHGVQAGDLEAFTLCCIMLDGRDPAAVANARSQWTDYKSAGHAVTYWQQGEKGWQKKS